MALSPHPYKSWDEVQWVLSHLYDSGRLDGGEGNAVRLAYRLITETQRSSHVSEPDEKEA